MLSVNIATCSSTQHIFYSKLLVYMNMYLFLWRVQNWCQLLASTRDRGVKEEEEEEKEEEGKMNAGTVGMR